MFIEVELDWRHAITHLLDWSERLSAEDKDRVSMHHVHLLEVTAINIRKVLNERGPASITTIPTKPLAGVVSVGTLACQHGTSAGKVCTSCARLESGI